MSWAWAVAPLIAAPFGDGEVDGQWEVERDHPLLEQHRAQLEALEQVAGGVADLLGVERDLLVAAEVHEDEVVAVAIEILHGAVSTSAGLQVTAAPGLGQRLARAQVLELALDHQARAPRRGRLRDHLGHLPRVAVESPGCRRASAPVTLMTIRSLYPRRGRVSSEEGGRGPCRAARGILARGISSGRMNGASWDVQEALGWMGFAVVSAFLVAPVGAQGARGKAELKAGSGAITVDYGRPSLKGRDMLSELKPGDFWRMGMNQATVLTTPVDLTFGAATVAKGSYSLWLKKVGDKFELVFNSQTGQWGTQHDPAKDVCSVALKPEPLAAPVETFTMDLTAAAKGGDLSLSWGATKLSAAFELGK